MDVAGIIIHWLDQNGYDGLFNNTAGCACLRGDLAPCESITLGCCPGVQEHLERIDDRCEDLDCPDEPHWHIIAKEKRASQSNPAGSSTPYV